MKEYNNKESNFVSAVVYVNNGEKNIKDFLNMLIDVLSKNFLKYEIICVNDCSYDNSCEIIKEVAHSRDVVMSIINMSYNQGRELSMNAGIDLAIGDFVFEFDNLDMDYKPEVIMEIYRKSLSGFDIVCARAKRRMRVTSSLFYKLFNRFSNSQFNLNTDTFRILSRRAINRIHSINKLIPYRKALYVKCGLQMAYVDYDVNNSRRASLTKADKSERRRNASDALILFTNVFYKMSVFIAMFMMIVLVCFGIYAIVIFINGIPIAGWTSTILFLSFCFFMLFMMISIIMKYLSLIVSLLFKNARYLVASIDKVNSGVERAG